MSLEDLEQEIKAMKRRLATAEEKFEVLKEKQGKQGNRVIYIYIVFFYTSAEGEFSNNHTRREILRRAVAYTFWKRTFGEKIRFLRGLSNVFFRT